MSLDDAVWHGRPQGRPLSFLPGFMFPGTAYDARVTVGARSALQHHV